MPRKRRRSPRCGSDAQRWRYTSGTSSRVPSPRPGGNEIARHRRGGGREGGHARKKKRRPPNGGGRRPTEVASGSWCLASSIKSVDPQRLSNCSQSGYDLDSPPGGRSTVLTADATCCRTVHYEKRRVRGWSTPDEDELARLRLRHGPRLIFVGCPSQHGLCLIVPSAAAPSSVRPRYRRLGLSPTKAIFPAP